MVKIYEYEHRSIDLIDPDIKFIIVYPQRIQVPIHMHKDLSVVSPTPHTISENQQSIHIFDSITFDGNLLSLINQCIWLNHSYRPIIFAIKKLTCLNNNTQRPSNINNLIIHIQTQPKSKSTNSLEKTVIHESVFKATALYNLNKQNYRLFKTIQKPEQQKPIAFFKHIFNASPSSPAQRTEIDKSMQTILNKPDITLANQNLSYIITELEKKIDTTTVQELDSLQKALLQKQEDIKRKTYAYPIEPGIKMPVPQYQKIEPIFTATPVAKKPPVQQGALARLYNWWYGK